MPPCFPERTPTPYDRCEKHTSTQGLLFNYQLGLSSPPNNSACIGITNSYYFTLHYARKGAGQKIYVVSTHRAGATAQIEKTFLSDSAPGRVCCCDCFINSSKRCQTEERKSAPLGVCTSWVWHARSFTIFSTLFPETFRTTKMQNSRSQHPCTKVGGRSGQVCRV